MSIYRWIKQLLCHHFIYPTIIVPIVGQRPDEPETIQVFCCNCGVRLYTKFTDNAGTERR